MDRYRASIDSVNQALDRLNQTLATYQLSKNHGQVENPAPPTVETASESKCSDDTRQAILRLRATIDYPEPFPGEQRLQRVKDALHLVTETPYNLVVHLFTAIDFLGLGYPDLATGSAYKALLLCDALESEAEEYHDEALEALEQVIAEQPLQERIDLLRNAVSARDEEAWESESEPELDIEVYHWLDTHYRLVLYRILIRSLIECGSYRTAHSYALQSLRLYPNDAEIQRLLADVKECATKAIHDDSILDSPSEWPDHGFVRRELYAWNEHEPDRLNELQTLNEVMRKVAPKLEVKAVQLPALIDGSDTTVTQLGVFAKEDLAPGQIILDETSLLTANNKLQDALCDACSSDLPDLDTPAAASVASCPECDVVFCTPRCFDDAMTTYHPALCGKDVEAIAKDVAPTDAADALYSLLLLRAFAMAETQDVHPLDLREITYIWGDFTPTPSSFPPADAAPAPRTLPFSFDHNVRLPFHMLEKMDLDIFAHAACDVWVFNTLYAKFRGTASARLSGREGRPVRGPEVGAVHPMWCLANHSCDPNVRWDWGGSVRFEVRAERVRWERRQEGEEIAATETTRTETREASVPGIRKGEEVVNHYCDIDLPVRERREWARGALGGQCLCDRCKWEAGETS